MLVWRPHLSPYHASYFTTEEQKIAHKHGLAYAGPETPLEEILSQREELIVLTNTHTKAISWPQQLLDRIKLIIHPNSGFDAFSYNWVQNCSFPVVLGNEIRAHAVCNTILSHLLHHYSPLHRQESWQTERSYPRALLQELSLLIIGHGHIGQLLHQVLTPLVKELKIHDPYLGKTENDLVADIIVTVPSLTKSSFHMINKEFLDQLPDNYCLINCSRGEVLELQSLLNNLKQRPKAHAYLDVFEDEPKDISSLAQVPNLSCTSHIAGVYTNIDQETLKFEDKILDSFINDGQFFDDYKNIILNYKKEHDFR